MEPAVSVCIPARRNNPWFCQAVRSALEQSFGDLEVIISDDSGGSLREAVQTMTDPRVRYLVNDVPLGLARNHVAALDAATGRYVAFLHDDDEWHHDHLRLASAVLERNPDVGLVLSGCDEVDEAGALLRRRPTTMRPGQQEDALAELLGDDVMLMLPSAAVFRRTALEANARPWPDVPAADMTMFVDVAAAGWRVFYVDRALVRYRVHPSQVGSDQLVHRDAVVRVWQSYAFGSHSHEQLRRRRLAVDLLARAGELLKRGDTVAARRDLASARALHRRAGFTRAVVLATLTCAPRLAAPAGRVWEKFKALSP